MRVALRFARLAGFIVFAFGSTQCAVQQPESAPKRAFLTTIDSLTHEETGLNVPGVSLHISWPSEKINRSVSEGYADLADKTPLSNRHVFRIASVTKTFVAATVLRLYERGQINLDAPIGQFIAPKHLELLKNGGYQAEKITVKHLLAHASGLFDHTHAPQFFAQIESNPAHKWTRTEQITMAVEKGKPIGDVGAQFSYSDTGYILLGEIIEKITGKRLGEAVEEQLRFKKLGLKNTWFEYDDSAARNNALRAHQYMEGQDTYNFHASIDLYGGGGLLSTCEDLTTFFQALFAGKVFAKKSTLDLMLTPAFTYPNASNMDYRLGIYKIKVDNEEAYCHAGFWGTQVIYLPKFNASIAANYTQFWKKRGNAPILEKTVAAMKAYKGKS